MTDTIYYYCRFCAERLAARLVLDFDSHPTVREDVQKKISIFQHSFIDLELKILPQSICKSCYETLNRAFLFANNVRKSQIVLIELYLEIIGSDDDDNDESLSKIRRSVEGPLCVNGEDTSFHEEQSTYHSRDKEDFLINRNKCVGAEAIKDFSDEGATSLGIHETGKEPNVVIELVNLDSTAAKNDTSISQNHESITIIECKEETSDNEDHTDRTVNTDSTEDRGTVVKKTELSQNQDSHECKEETTENDEETDRTVNIDSIGDSGAILKATASSQNQESLDCEEETSDNDYEDTELVDPLDVTTDVDPIMRDTLSLQGQDTYESPGEVTSSGHDSVCKEPYVESDLFNLNTTATGKDITTPPNHELLTTIEYKEETTDNEEDSDKIDKTYSTEDRASVVKETAAPKTLDSVQCIEQKKQKKRKTENIDKDYDESQQKKKRKKETDDNDYEDSNSKDQIDSTTDSDPILKETVPLHRQETSECQETLTGEDPRVDRVSVSVVTWNTNLYDCRLCVSKFSDINSLREHCKSLHQVCNGFRCRECSMELADFDAFVSHHREHRPKLEEFCQFCNMELKSAGAGHVASHGDLFCKFCGEVFTSASGFKEHYLLYAPEAVNNGRSHCVHCGHELGNDETPHRDSLSDACGACGEHFREQTLQQRDRTQKCDLNRNRKIFNNENRKLVRKYYECDHCHKQFNIKTDLRSHMVIHYNVYPFYCKFCDAKFKLSSNWFRHLKSGKHAKTAAGETSSVTLEKYFECDHCHKQFNGKSTLQQHMTIHYEVYPFYCKLCDAKFKRSSHWKQHLKSDKHARAAGETSSLRTQKYFECDHSHKQFKRKPHLQEHMVIHHDVYPFYCKLCDAKFKRSYHWKQHLQSSKHARASGDTTSLTLENYFRCDHCHKQFKRKDNLQEHMATHYDVYPFYCKLCDAKFKRSSHWKQHLQSSKHARASGDTTSLTLENYFRCDHCHKQFKRKDNLQEHMATHYDVYPFYCKLCDAKFKQHRHWKQHLKSDKHARAAGDTSSLRIQKYFECDHCHKQFECKSNLQQHMATHYDVYPFYCKLCDAKFKQHRHWKQHLKSDKHARAAGDTSSLRIQKYFECDHCHKQFKLKTCLQEHMAIHYDVYPFFCKFCDAKFKLSSPWQRHLKSDKHARTAAGDTSSVTLSGNYFECDHCHKQFKWKAYLQEHMASHYDVYRFYCKFCDAKFKRISSWKEHLSTDKHARAAGDTSSLRIQKYFECDHCHKQFKRKPLLQRHMTSHYDVYPFYCKFCDAKFKRISSWKEHLSTDKHARAAGDTSSLRIQKYFECDHCHKQFKRKPLLQRHMTSHYDVYPFYCKFCDAKFKRISSWKEHLSTDKHARAAGDTSSLRIQKYFECDHCHKQFKRKPLLQRHMTSHYDVYPFYCKFCDAKFKRSSNWKQHLKSDKHAWAARAALSKTFQMET